LKWKKSAGRDPEMTARNTGPESPILRSSVIKSGDKGGRIKAGENCAIGRFWDEISASGDVRAPGSEEIL